MDYSNFLKRILIAAFLALSIAASAFAEDCAKMLTDPSGNPISCDSIGDVNTPVFKLCCPPRVTVTGEKKNYNCPSKADFTIAPNKGVDPLKEKTTDGKTSDNAA